MLRSYFFGVAAACVVCALPAKADPPSGTRKPNQVVIISFDGAHDIAQWRRSRALANSTGASFTYFLSCVFLLSPQTKGVYQPPHMKAGRSNVGFGASRDEVEQRLYQIRLAVQEGNELASHGCGHFDGGSWSKADWEQEFDAFRRILRDAYAINGIGHEPAQWWQIVDQVEGFRAPYLSAGKPMYQALQEEAYTYDASGISRGPEAPFLKGAVEHFALPQIAEGPKGRRVIAMDYNIYVRHSKGKDDPTRAAQFQGRTYEAFKRAFDKEYEGTRVPLQLGFHFTLMNGAAYWRALERFAQEACRRPDVACVSYRDYLARQGKPARQAGG